MSLILIKVIWGNEILTDVESINIRRDSEANASYANITLKNSIDKIITGFSYPLGKYVTTSNSMSFTEGDSIKIYVASTDTVRDIDTSATSTDLIITGEVAEVNGKSSESGAKLMIKAVDKTWVILNKLHVFNYKVGDGLTAPQIIQNVIQSVTGDVQEGESGFDANGNIKTSGKGRYSVDARLMTGEYPCVSGSPPAYMQNRRINSTAFPAKGIAKIYKPAYEFIKDLSTLEYTNDFSSEDEDNPPQDRTMMFYIDETNRFHWFYPTDTVGSGLTFIEGDDSTGNKIISMNMTYATFDIVNLVFFNCGKDLFGNGISSYLYDKNTKSKDMKQVYKPYTEIAKELISAEIGATYLNLDNSQTDFTYEGNNYTSDAYNHATTWGDTVTSDSDYNSSLRTEAIVRGKGKALKLVQKKGSPRWKGTIECKFRIYNPMELIELTSTRLGINQKKLRIMSVSYNITKSGAFVSLNVEEDEQKRGDV